ncbi:MAG TPA: valine--tRNA ligase [Gammaproteobacteria bacterium]|nr:valine--tRNA ligase [Gammaproteobacteria bacterium]
MEKTYEPGDIERRWYDTWEQAGCFKPADTGTPYCILLPPPNVTGTLHMGHAFQQTLMDALIRYHRMRGDAALWQCGTDHAGIATQKIVENQLAAEDKTRHHLGREKFIERVWQWKQESGSTISRQMRRIGDSCDWSRERFTMDTGLSAAVRRVFVEWYRAGLLYRGKRLVHWDPVLQTAVSDLEVNNEERDGHLWYIRYNIVNPQAGAPDHVVVATTRPETMLGDVAVAVHPGDARYQKLIGKKLRLPLTEREIPVIADEYVDKEFGTGCVKITPAHDFNDYSIGQRHQLPLINIFTKDAKIVGDSDWHSLQRSSNPLPLEVSGVIDMATDIGIPEKYIGLDRFAARKQVLADLETQGLLVETKKHKLMVPISQRSDAVIEPMLTDQWFLDLTSDTRVDGKPGPGGKKAITEPALDAVRSGDIKFVPENWSTTYTQWLDNIQDWCVSRQLWWGHRIPAWFDEAGNIFVGEDEADAIAHGDINPVGKLKQDDDVLDTWFSSALWPFSTMGWPSQDPIRNDRNDVVANWNADQRFLPSAVLVTGFDIIFFWVARMVMATQYFTGKVPFREVYINAIVRDAEGQKMSKSKGNTIDPLDLIDGISLEALVTKSTASLLIPQQREKVEKRIRRDYPEGIPAVGADALRFTFAALATYGRTINFDLKRCEGYRNFCTKLWNASRFVLMNCEGFTAGGEPPLKTPAEHWIVRKLDHLLQAIPKHFETYRFDLLAQDLYEFTWNDFCDWFIELSKPALNGTDKAAADSTRHTLLYVLETLLRALHPIIPFISEELWQQVAPKLGKQGKSISVEPYPDADDIKRADTANDIEWLRMAIVKIREIRSEMNLSPALAIPLLIEDRSSDPQRWARIEASLKFIARIESLRVLAANEAAPPSAIGVLDQANLMIPLAGLIDTDAEIARLEKLLDKQRQELARTEAKLGNQSFVSGAPEAVVNGVRTKAEEVRAAIKELEQQVTRMHSLT